MYHRKEENRECIPPEPPPVHQKTLLQNQNVPLLKPEQFPHPPDNVSYVKVGPYYSNKSLYKMMRLSAGKLYRDFQGTKSMSGWIQIKVEKVKEATPGVHYAKDKEGATIAKALALFNTGSD